MFKGILRFVLVLALSRLLAPYVDRFVSRLLTRVPTDSFIGEVLDSIRTSYSTTLVRSFGESMGEMVFGPAGGKSRKRI